MGHFSINTVKMGYSKTAKEQKDKGVSSCPPDIGDADCNCASASEVKYLLVELC